jgi:hypothetical protein
MAVFHHYDCAGLDEPVDRIAERLWQFCVAAIGGEPRAGGLVGGDASESAQGEVTPN